MKLILASQSPRRKEILESVGLKFDIMPVDADESLPEGIECADAVTMLARRKAKALFEAHLFIQCWSNLRTMRLEQLYLAYKHKVILIAGAKRSLMVV